MIGAVGRIGYLGLQGGSRLLYPAYVRDYLDRVTAADVLAGNTQGLERGVTDGFNISLQGMVADGSLGISGGVLAQAASLVKAGCFMAGARTLSGALTPIAADMPAPTNFNFVSGDYDRKTGLAGDGSTKYLNSNRNNNADPQDNNHNAIFVNTATSITSTYLGSKNGTGGVGGNDIGKVLVPSYLFHRNRQINAGGTGTGSETGLIGTSRANAENYVFRSGGTNTTIAITSQVPFDQNVSIFASGTGTTVSNARLAFYSIGESLDLALLDARLTALMNTFAAVIP